MTLQDGFEKALQSEEPTQALRLLVDQFACKGYGKDEIYGFFEAFLLHLRHGENRKEAEEDMVLDVMDALTGWCHPSARLLADINERE